jgi:coenzyme F420-reducing hydrogenase beta subunit
MTQKIQQECIVRDIIENDLCIGCGACVANSASVASMAFDEYGMLKPVGVGGSDALLVCPFSNQSLNEDRVAEQRWPHLPRDERIGRYDSAYAGNITSEQDREDGSSGGLTTWLLRALLRAGMIDGVAHVKPADPRTEQIGRMFKYGISRSVEELNQGRGSRYYPVEISGIVETIKSEPGRYAVVAIPCIAKALRNLMAQDPLLNERITFIVGLVCGHLKSRYFADFIADIPGGKFGKNLSVKFRHKLPGRAASDYSVGATELSGEVVGKRPLRDYFATSWEIGAFRNPACDFCDDVLAETADVVLGDAWIEPYDRSWLGTNVVVTRDPALRKILLQGAERAEIELAPLSVDQIAQSQDGGLRHRREGLAFRLRQRDERGIWRPNKRVHPESFEISQKRQGIYRDRAELSWASHQALRVARRFNSIAVFKLLFSWPAFNYHLKTAGFKRAITQSLPGRWLVRQIKRK